MDRRDGLRTNYSFLAFSSANDSLLADLTERADTLFSLGWLRQRLWKWIQECVAMNEASQKADYGQVFRGSFEHRFAWGYLQHCRVALDDVRRIIDNSFEDDNLRAELQQERCRCIEEFSSIPFAAKWPQVGIEKPDSWKVFARRMPFDDLKREQDINRFFELIDSISILTDILNHRAADYGINIDISIYERTAKPLTPEILESAISDCVPYFCNDSSKWAAVFKVIYTDHRHFVADGEQIAKGYAAFERFARKLNKQHPDLPTCPSSTISHAFANNPFLNEAITRWPDGEMKTLADELRKTIKGRCHG